MQREAGLNAKGYSEKDEKRILDALGRGLLREFPNPDRAGCPGSAVLKRIASHEMPLAEAEKWLDHLTSCSPCYRDFSQLQVAYQHRRTRAFLAIAASILIAACLAGWALFLRHNEPLRTQTALLDLRNRSIPRGTELNPSEEPLEIARNVSHLEIYLPLGSSDGDYGIRISGPEGKVLFVTRGIAKMQQGITSLAADVNLSSARPGLYILQLQKADSGWTSYPLRVR
ncbi:MAG: hypothetical protein ABSH01_00390 [Terriglobia bacterium]